MREAGLDWFDRLDRLVEGGLDITIYLGIMHDLDSHPAGGIGRGSTVIRI